MVMRRMDSDGRKAVIAKAAASVAERNGIMHLDHISVAEACDIPTSESTVRRYHHTLDDLRRTACEMSDTVRAEARQLGLVK